MNLEFMSLIQMFQMQAMVGMGKLKNPVTDKIEENKEQAKFCIDMLVMLEEKTKGNLTDEEKRALNYVLQDLRLNYVAEEKPHNTLPEEEATA